MILAIAAVIVWRIDTRLADARAIGGKLVAESGGPGIRTGDIRATDRNRPSRAEREQEAKRLAVAYIALPKAKQRIVIPSVEYATDVEQQIAALDPSRLKIFIADVLASMELDGTIVPERVNNLLRNLARNDPRGALALFTEHASVCRKDLGFDVVSTALGAWAKDDPLAAVEWMKKNAGEFPEALSGQSIANVFHWAAEKDPRLAFSLITGLGLDSRNAHSAMNDIVTVAKTDEERTATLAAFREYRDANQADKVLTQAADDNLGYLATGLRKESFEAASKWVESAKLTPKELDSFCGEMTRNYDGDEPAQWIEWIGANFPPGKGDDPIMDLIRCWTNQDYEAAGKWLASAAEGPVKNAAIRSYAQEIFPHDPETAMQWIMTLPPSKERQNTLQFILWNCLRDDPEAAAAFAEEHGLK